MKINTKSLHYKWGEFFYQWSFFRSGISKPVTLCGYFWKWLVFSPFCTAFAASALLMAILIVIAAVAAYFIGPLTLAVMFYIDPNLYFYETVDGVESVSAVYDGGIYAVIGFSVLQLLLWWVVFRKYLQEKNLFPHNHTTVVIGESFSAMKNGVCPILKYEYNKH